MDRETANAAAQAWIEVCDDEQAALNRFAHLEEALCSLLPEGDVPWSVASVEGVPSVLAVAGRSLFTLSVRRGERSGAAPAEVQCRHVTVAPERTIVTVAESSESRARRRRWTFAFAGQAPLEIETTESVRGHFTRESAPSRDERLARALAAAAGWETPLAGRPGPSRTAPP